MNAKQIENYVCEYLSDASREMLIEIIDHGIYNTGAVVIDGDNDDEHDAIHNEFDNQARKLARE